MRVIFTKRLYKILILLFPKRLSSQLISFLVKQESPKFLLILSIRCFLKFFKVNQSELEKKIDEYKNFQEFFSRGLPAGMRTFEAELCSPVDGRLVERGPLNEQSTLLIKGNCYPLEQLIAPCQNEYDSNHQNSFFHFYLSPRDYHRIHAPFDLTLHRVGIYSGTILPVGDLALNVFPRLLATNTRWVFEFSSKHYGNGWLSAIAALHVASFYSPHMPNTPLPEKGEYASIAIHKEISKGMELGRFLMGSSVVLIVNKHISVETLRENGHVLCGQSLIRI